MFENHHGKTNKKNTIKIFFIICLLILLSILLYPNFSIVNPENNDSSKKLSLTDDFTSGSVLKINPNYNDKEKIEKVEHLNKEVSKEGEESLVQDCAGGLNVKVPIKKIYLDNEVSDEEILQNQKIFIENINILIKNFKGIVYDEPKSFVSMYEYLNFISHSDGTISLNLDGIATYSYFTTRCKYEDEKKLLIFHPLNLYLRRCSNFKIKKDKDYEEYIKLIANTIFIMLLKFTEKISEVSEKNKNLFIKHTDGIIFHECFYETYSNIYDCLRLYKDLIGLGFTGNKQKVKELSIALEANYYFTFLIELNKIEIGTKNKELNELCNLFNDNEEKLKDISKIADEIHKIIGFIDQKIKKLNTGNPKIISQNLYEQFSNLESRINKIKIKERIEHISSDIEIKANIKLVFQNIEELFRDIKASKKFIYDEDNPEKQSA